MTATAEKPATTPEPQHKGMAFKATIGPHDAVVRLVGEKPEDWEYRKDGKVVGSFAKSDLAKQAALRDCKCAEPSKVKWTRVDDPGPDPQAMTDGDFRAEMKSLGCKVHLADRRVEDATKDLDRAKGKLKEVEAERDTLYRQMVDLADDERKGQGRFNLGRPKDNGAAPKAAKKRAAKKTAKKAAKKKTAKK